MSAPAQVTEAHRATAETIFKLAEKAAHNGDPFREPCAQLIADSEAKAVEQTNAQVESLLSAAKNAIPASEHPAEPTVQNWAWQIRNLGDDRRLVYADRDKLRAEVKESKERERVAIASWDEERQRALREGGRVVELRAEVERLKSDGAASVFVNMSCRASRAETERNNLRADLDAIKAILTEEKGRAERAEAELSAEQDMRMLIGAELATERARLDWLGSDAGMEFQWETTKVITRAAIDAAMKEETK